MVICLYMFFYFILHACLEIRYFFNLEVFFRGPRWLLDLARFLTTMPSDRKQYIIIHMVFLYSYGSTLMGDRNLITQGYRMQRTFNEGF